MRKVWRKIKEIIFLRPRLYFALGVIFIITILIIYWPLILIKLGLENPAYTGEEITLDSGGYTAKLVKKEGKLVIPKIKVSPPIVFMKWSQNATDDEIQAKIQKYLEKGVGHYQNTALPGQIGNVFITGHSSNYPWAAGKYNYVFANLDNLVKDDKVTIYFNNNKFVYEVYEKKVVSPNDRSVQRQSSESILTLMTCTPVGTDINRLVVRCRQISPDPKLNVIKYIEK